MKNRYCALVLVCCLVVSVRASQDDCLPHGQKVKKEEAARLANTAEYCARQRQQMQKRLQQQAAFTDQRNGEKDQQPLSSKDARQKARQKTLGTELLRTLGKLTLDSPATSGDKTPEINVPPTYAAPSDNNNSTVSLEPTIVFNVQQMPFLLEPGSSALGCELSPFKQGGSIPYDAAKQLPVSDEFSLSQTTGDRRPSWSGKPCSKNSLRSDSFEGNPTGEYNAMLESRGTCSYLKNIFCCCCGDKA